MHTNSHKLDSTFNKIAIQAAAQMDADKEAVGLSRVHIYASKCMRVLSILFVNHSGYRHCSV